MGRPWLLWQGEISSKFNTITNAKLGKFAWLCAFKYRTIELMALKFGYTQIKQTARATIGTGEIIIRSNLEQDISDLNRDSSKAVTLKTNIDIELPTLKDPIKSILDGIDTLGMLEQKQMILMMPAG